MHEDYVSTYVYFLATCILSIRDFHLTLKKDSKEGSKEGRNEARKQGRREEGKLNHEDGRKEGWNIKELE